MKSVVQVNYFNSHPVTYFRAVKICEITHTHIPGLVAAIKWCHYVISTSVLQIAECGFIFYYSYYPFHCVPAHGSCVAQKTCICLDILWQLPSSGKW